MGGEGGGDSVAGGEWWYSLRAAAVVLSLPVFLCLFRCVVIDTCIHTYIRPLACLFPRFGYNIIRVLKNCCLVYHVYICSSFAV